MPEFLTLLPPSEASAKLFSNLPAPEPASEQIEVIQALGRVTAEAVHAPQPLPDFRRSTVDGFAVRAGDTHGAGEALPAYLELVGEVPMGAAPQAALQSGQCMTIHTGGMLPEGADAVVMLEYTQSAREGEVEILRAVAKGENLISVGEDVAEGQLVLEKGSLVRPAEVGGLLALGITNLRVAKKVRVGLISSGDEVVPPSAAPRPGQVRDVNSYTLGSLIEQSGGEPILYGIVGDTIQALRETTAEALQECQAVIITAGSSASTRDLTAQVIDALGEPGVLVHGINTRPGKPTILGVCAGKAVIGLPGNPVSALVNGYMLVVPLVERLLGGSPRPRATVRARLSVNLASLAGREDWWPVKLIRRESKSVDYVAEPIFGKSNLIFTLVAADGLLRIPPDPTGLSAGELVEVLLV